MNFPQGGQPGDPHAHGFGRFDMGQQQQQQQQQQQHQQQQQQLLQHDMFHAGQKRPFHDERMPQQQHLHRQPQHAHPPQHGPYDHPPGFASTNGNGHFMPRFGDAPVGWRDPVSFVHENAEKRRMLLENPERLAMHLTELERVADECNGKLSAVQHELDATRAERDKLRLELHQSNEALSNFERQHKENSDGLLREIATLRTTADAWKSKLELNSKASNELAAVMAQQLQRLNATFEELRASKDQTERSCNERIQAMQREKDEAVKKYAQLQQAKAEADASANEKLATQAAEVEELQRQIKLGRSGFQVEFDGMVKKMEQAKAAQQAAERQAADRVALSKKENEVLRSKLLKAEAAVTAAEKAGVEKANAVRSEYERQLVDKQQLIDTQVQKISKAEEAVRRMKAERDVDRQQFEPNKKEIERLRNQIAEIEASKVELKEAAEQARRDVQAIRSQNEKLDGAYMNAMLSKSEQVRRTQQLEETITKLQAELEAEHWRCADLQAELQVLKTEGISATVKVSKS